MAYDGEFLNGSGMINIDCTNVAVVAVTGSWPNQCGHLLLGTGPKGAMTYFHVALVRGYPKYMTEAGYQRYLKDNKKSEIRRLHLSLPDPPAADRYLERLMSEKWNWLLVPNNCVAFVEEVIAAGGGKWGSYSNCPSVATQDTIGVQAARFWNQMEGEIFRAYGAPRF